MREHQCFLYINSLPDLLDTVKAPKVLMMGLYRTFGARKAAEIDNYQGTSKGHTRTSADFRPTTYRATHVGQVQVRLMGPRSSRLLDKSSLYRGLGLTRVA